MSLLKYYELFKLLWNYYVWKLIVYYKRLCKKISNKISCWKFSDHTTAHPLFPGITWDLQFSSRKTIPSSAWHWNRTGWLQHFGGQNPFSVLQKTNLEKASKNHWKSHWIRIEMAMVHHFLYCIPYVEKWFSILYPISIYIYTYIYIYIRVFYIFQISPTLSAISSTAKKHRLNRPGRKVGRRGPARPILCSVHARSFARMAVILLRWKWDAWCMETCIAVVRYLYRYL